MPVSSPKGKTLIKEWFEGQNDIKTIVDLGCGSGTYPKLLGDEYHWIGVDIWKPYVERFELKELYDEIITGDIEKCKLPDGDCAILGDVLEHIEKDGMIKTFHRVNRKYKHIVISIPLNSDSQYVFEGNEYEKHRSIWTALELERLIPSSYKIRIVFDPIAVYIK